MRHFLRAWVIFLVIIVALLLHAVGWLAPVEYAASVAVRPLQRLLVSWVPARTATDDENPDQRIRDLEAQVSRLLTENILLKEDRREATAFSEQQSFLASRSLKGVSVSIIGRSPEGDTQVILLDAGTERGIAAGQPVVTENGIFVGKIQEAEAGRSSAILITDSRSAIAAEVENQNRSPGLVSGQHGLTMTMDYIPQGELVEKDQAVVTSAIDVHTPANLAIGLVTDVFFATGDLFQRASVRPLIDFQRLRYVTVITL